MVAGADAGGTRDYSAGWINRVARETREWIGLFEWMNHGDRGATEHARRRVAEGDGFGQPMARSPHQLPCPPARARLAQVGQRMIALRATSVPTVSPWFIHSDDLHPLPRPRSPRSPTSAVVPGACGRGMRCRDLDEVLDRCSE